MSASFIDLTNRVSVVTGGSRGIGAAAALELARAGSDVAIFDLDGDEASAAAGSWSRQVYDIIQCDAASLNQDDAVRQTYGLGNVMSYEHRGKTAAPPSTCASPSCSKVCATPWPRTSAASIT